MINVFIWCCFLNSYSHNTRDRTGKYIFKSNCVFNSEFIKKNCDDDFCVITDSLQSQQEGGAMYICESNNDGYIPNVPNTLFGCLLDSPPPHHQVKIK